jgi:hypothetical protein
MATVFSGSFDEARPVATAKAPLRKRRRWWYLVVPVLVVLALPTIVGYTPLRNWALGLAAGDLEGTVECGSMSLGWFSSVSADELTIKGRDGKEVLSAKRVELGTSLATLVFAPRSLGEIRVDSPKLSVVFHERGSNVEDVLAKILAKERPPGPPLTATIAVSGGTATIEDAVAKRSWDVTKFDGNVELPGAGVIAARGSIAGQLAADPDTPRFDCKFELLRADESAAQNATPDEKSAKSNTFAIKTDNLPLDVLAPVLRRFDPQAQLAGRMTADATVAWPRRPTTPKTRKTPVRWPCAGELPQRRWNGAARRWARIA